MCNRCVEAKVQELEERNAELELLFNLQQPRKQSAVKLWQTATGSTAIPDLGVLLGWLMDQIKQLEAENARLRADLALKDMPRASADECLPVSKGRGKVSLTKESDNER